MKRLPRDTDFKPTDDLHCRRCGYLLRGMSLFDDCPECGQSVKSSIFSRRASRATSLEVSSIRIFAQWLCGLGAGCLALVVIGASALRPPGEAHVILIGFLLMSSTIAGAIASIILVFVAAVDAQNRWSCGIIALLSILIAIASWVIEWLG